MGYLWENMEKIDVQGTYEALTQVRTQLSDTEKKLAAAENHAQNAEAENARLKAMLETHGIKIPET